jgi:hypothetical protein
MLDCHVNAFLILPGRVLGRQLRPLTLAHYWILEAVDSPYVTGAVPAYADTVFAAFVLSHHPAFVRWLMVRPALMRFVFAAWGRRYKGMNIIGDMRAFSEYWKAYTAWPKQWDKGGPSKRSCLPTSIKLVWTIAGKVGERRAWSMPMPLAVAYFTAEAEWNGAEFKTEHDEYLKSLNAQPKAEATDG